MLIVAAHRRAEFFCKLGRRFDCAAQHHTGSVKNYRELGFRKQSCRTGDRVGTAGGALNTNDLG